MIKRSLSYRDPRTASVHNEASNTGGKHRRTVRGKKIHLHSQVKQHAKINLRWNTARHIDHHHDGASEGSLCRVQTAHTTVGTADK